MKNPGEAIQTAKDGLSKLKDSGAIMEGLDTVVTIYVGIDEPEDALAFLQRELDGVKRGGDKTVEASVSLKMAEVHLKATEADQAVRPASEAVSLFRAAGDKKGEARALVVLAEVRLAQDEGGQALRAAQSAMAAWEGFGLRAGRDGMP